MHLEKSPFSIISRKEFSQVFSPQMKTKIPSCPDLIGSQSHVLLNQQQWRVSG